jgi:hypothetical protein
MPLAALQQFSMACLPRSAMALILCGALLLGLAWLRYRLVTRDILHNRVRWDPRLGMLLTAVLVLAGILLAVYLIITA